MKCPICGAYNSDDDSRCFICGSKLDFNPYESDLADLEEIAAENADITKSVLDMKGQKKPKKRKFSDKIMAFVLILILLSILCSCFSCLFSMFLSKNKEKTEEYIKNNEVINDLLEDWGIPLDEDPKEPEITKEEYKEHLKYNELELQDVSDNTIDLKLPVNFEEQEIAPDEEADADVRCWKYGVDFDIIQVGTMTEYSDMEEAATMVYQNGVDAGYCDNMQIEEDTISGYSALKVSGLDSYNQQYIVMWLFEAKDKDNYVHYFAANVLVEDKLLLECKDTYVYKGSEEN